MRRREGFIAAAIRLALSSLTTPRGAPATRGRPAPAGTPCAPRPAAPGTAAPGRAGPSSTPASAGHAPYPGADRSTVEVGREGEASVARILTEAGHEHRGDLMVQAGPHRFAQVDHLAVVGDTLVAIETKHLSGTLRGGAGDERWTQVRPGEPPRGFQSPLAQNAGHVAAVRSVVGAAVPLRSLVVLTGTAAAPFPHPDVVRLVDLRPTLANIAAARGGPGRDVALSKLSYLARLSSQVDRATADASHAAASARADEGLAPRGGPPRRPGGGWRP